MRKPPESASPDQRVRVGFYVTRRLRRAKLADMAEAMGNATLSVKNAARAWEDAA